MLKKKKTILILGATGMLGSALYNHFKNKYSLILAVRDLKKIDLLEKKYGSVGSHRIVQFDAIKPNYDSFGKIDFAINAIGILIKASNDDPQLAKQINSVLPHLLANEYGPKLIHITTDCVFSGTEGYPYDENSPKKPKDVYSQTKSDGEPKNCLTLRTSIVGEELSSFTGLLEWFRHQKSKQISGYANHFWNGVTTKEFAKICEKIFENRENFPQKGIYHVFSNVVSKYNMLLAFQQKYNIDCKIEKDTNQKLDRSLATIFPLCESLKIPTFNEMLADL